MTRDRRQAVLFDWGNTVMRCFPSFAGPMHEWPRVEAVQGIRDAIFGLRSESLIALATNAEDSSESDIRRALRRCDLSNLIDDVFCFRDLGHRKPAPAFYLSVLDALGLNASAVFMVGDSLRDDVLAANEVGISAVWFNPASADEHSGEKSRTVHCFEDLAAALRQLGAKVS